MWAEAREKTLESSSRAVGLGSWRKMSGEIMVVAKAAGPLLPRDHGRYIDIWKIYTDYMGVEADDI
jgi:hypothetical protein